MPLARIYLSMSDRPWSEYNGLGQNLSVLVRLIKRSWPEFIVLGQLFLVRSLCVKIESIVFNQLADQWRKKKKKEEEEEKTITGGFLLD